MEAEEKKEFIFKLLNRDFKNGTCTCLLNTNYGNVKQKLLLLLNRKQAGLAGKLADGVNVLSTLNVDNEQKQAE